MIFLSEEETAAAITRELAFEAAREALILAVDPESRVFPAVIAHGTDRGNRFSVKAGVAGAAAGAKMGFNWPANKQRGVPSHNSVTLLIDQRVGRIGAVVESGAVNAYRTAAADAVAADVLARSNSRTLAVFGAGNQAGHECLALAQVRPIERVLVVSRDATKGEAFAARLAAHGLPARAADAREACMEADIVVTATSSREPLFEAGWVRPGTHIAAMGADSKGKQELPPALLTDGALLFCDLPEQSLAIGEFQHAAIAVAAEQVSVTAVGEVLLGRALGRRSTEEITLFDSSGIALQDLCVARRLLAMLRPEACFG